MQSAGMISEKKKTCRRTDFVSYTLQVLKNDKLYFEYLGQV